MNLHPSAGGHIFALLRCIATRFNPELPLLPPPNVSHGRRATSAARSPCRRLDRVKATGTALIRSIKRRNGLFSRRISASIRSALLHSDPNGGNREPLSVSPLGRDKVFTAVRSLWSFFVCSGSNDELIW